MLYTNRTRKYMISFAIICFILLYYFIPRYIDLNIVYDYSNLYDDNWIYPGTTGRSVFTVSKTGFVDFEWFRKAFYKETHKYLDNEISFDEDNDILVVCHGIKLTQLHYIKFIRSYYIYIGGAYYYNGRYSSIKEDDPTSAHIYVLKNCVQIEFS